MSYTHYWERPAILSVRKFKAAARGCRKAVEHLASVHAIHVQYDQDSSLPAEFGSSRIQFNGESMDGHETFMVERVFKPSYQGKTPSLTGLWADFCKTARKPYDAAVCACLIVLRHHFGEKFIIDSDGNEEEEGWPTARRVCRDVLNYGADFSLLTSRIQRLPRGGLAYKASPNHYFPTSFKVLSNEWLLFKQRGPLGGIRVLNQSRETLFGASGSLRKVCWLATVLHISETLKGAVNGEPKVDLEPFLADARGTLHNWTPLAILADALEEKDDVRYRVLRALLPKGR